MHSMKTYIFTYNSTFGETAEVMSMLKNIDSIVDLRQPFPGLFLLKSSDTAQILSKKIIDFKPNNRFLISEISDNRQGWLPRDNWEFIKDN